MAITLLNLGTVPGDKTGTDGRAGGQIINDNFDQCLVADGSVDSIANQHFNANITLGDALPDPDISIYGDVTGATTGNNALVSGLRFDVENVSTDGRIPLATGIVNITNLSGTGYTFGLSTGILNYARHGGSGQCFLLAGVDSHVEVGLGVTGTVTKAVGNRVSSLMRGTGTVDECIGMEVLDMGGGGSTINNTLGFNIFKQTDGIVSNTGGWFSGDGIGADLVFGASKDANIYYDGTNLVINPKMVGSGYLDVKGSVVATDYNGVALDATGSSSLFLNQAGAYVSVSVSPADFFHVQPTTVQNVGGSNGTVTYISWDTTPLHSDTASFTHSSTVNPSRVEVDVTGRYHVKASVSAETLGASRTTLMTHLRVDGTTDVVRGRHRNYSRGAVYGDISVIHDTEIELTAGQYIELGITVQDTDGVYTVNSIVAESEIIIRRLG